MVNPLRKTEAQVDFMMNKQYKKRLSLNDKGSRVIVYKYPEFYLYFTFQDSKSVAVTIVGNDSTITDALVKKWFSDNSWNAPNTLHRSWQNQYKFQDPDGSITSYEADAIKSAPTTWVLWDSERYQSK